MKRAFALIARILSLYFAIFQIFYVNGNNISQNYRDVFNNSELFANIYEFVMKSPPVSSDVFICDVRHLRTVFFFAANQL